MNLEILRHNHGKACQSWWHQIFETDRRNATGITECFSEEALHVFEKERWYTVYKSSLFGPLLHVI